MRWIPQGDPAWRQLHLSWIKSSFRLEAQQTYSKDSEDAAVASFVAGESPDMDFGWALSDMRERTAGGKVSINVRVVVEPPTDYTRWELAVYPPFAEAGEDIRIISVTEGDWPEGVPREDYFLFDDEQVWRMVYKPNHRFVGALLLDEPEEIDQYRRWTENALALAVPLDQYLAEKPENARPAPR